MLKKMLENKEEMSPEDKAAKLAVLKMLKKVAGEMMADEMQGKLMPESMKQVTVAAPDEEGLKEGLEKAEEVIEKMPEDMMAEQESEDEESEDKEEMMAEGSEDSEAEKLKALLAAKKMQA
jgi:hypothetical protein